MSTILPANVAAYFESLVPVVQFDLLEQFDENNPVNVIPFDYDAH